MQIRAFSFFVIALGIFAGLPPHTCAQNIWLSDLPSIEDGRYKVDPYLKAAEKLQGMGRHAAIQQLYGLAHAADTLGSESLGTEKTVVLCRMLFTYKPGFTLKPPPSFPVRLYGEDHSFETSYTNWPSEPIELVDGIPFVIVHGSDGDFMSEPHPTESYVQYCITNGVWTSFHYTQKSDAEKRDALKKLIASPKWNRPLTKVEQQQLTEQIQ